MASAQVLPNPGAASARKQGHLEAGKRRLEEFRKQKAEERKKKAAATSQLPKASTDDLNQNISHLSDTNGSKSDQDSDAVVEPSGLTIMSDSSGLSSFQNNAADLPNGVHETADGNDKYSDEVDTSIKDDESILYRVSGFSGSANVHDDRGEDKISENKVERSDLISAKLQIALNSVQRSPIIDGETKHPDVYAQVKPGNYTSQEKHGKILESSFALSSGNLHENSRYSLHQHTMGISDSPSLNIIDVNDGNMDLKNSVDVNTRGSKISDSIKRHLNIENTAWCTPEPSLMEYNSTYKNSYVENSFPSAIVGSGSGRSRPSFLDSINISRASSTSNLLSTQLVKADSPVCHDSNSTNGDLLSIYSPRPSFAKTDTFETAGLRYESPKEEMKLTMEKEDNFASLEQHIEDLTQEKFSLQRALDTSRSLTESLASENSSLTDSFNQQGTVINQLKSDMEQLQNEIRTQLAAFEALRLEYANAQLECNAADERSKILASEVISLEEKALRLRSNELKLEKQLENSNAEIASCRRKLSNLEKEHNEFQSTIEALQEEKKLLQSKLWKATLNGNATESSSTHTKKDACTSTVDLVFEGETDLTGIVSVRNSPEELGSSSSTIISEDYSHSNLQHDRNTSVPPMSGTIPDDQIRMISNINSLISELALEKEELVQALAAESSMNSKLKDLNKELSQKLEAQTQRFELLAAQQMANGNIHTRQIDTQNIHYTTEYTDEGDEVVERVLGWIMKLFPGGPPKRRTSKLL